MEQQDQYLILNQWKTNTIDPKSQVCIYEGI